MPFVMVDHFFKSTYLVQDLCWYALDEVWESLQMIHIINNREKEDKGYWKSGVISQ